MTESIQNSIIDYVTPVLTVAKQEKEETMATENKQKITALYCRLSQEDALQGESNSILWFNSQLPYLYQFDMG